MLCLQDLHEALAVPKSKDKVSREPILISLCVHIYINTYSQKTAQGKSERLYFQSLSIDYSSMLNNLSEFAF